MGFSKLHKQLSSKRCKFHISNLNTEVDITYANIKKQINFLDGSLIQLLRME